MPVYLPLCALRQDLLPAACRSCAWWLTTGVAPSGQEAGHAKRKAWMTATEVTWGSTGLIDPAGILPSGEVASDAGGSIQFAPVSAVPRLRTLPLGPLPGEAALIFCLRIQAPPNRPLARRLLQKAVGQIKERGVEEAYAYASIHGGTEGGHDCQFFEPELLESVGFAPVLREGQLILMKVDLRGTLAFVTQFRNALARRLHPEPAVSPAAFDDRGGSAFFRTSGFG